VLNVDDVLKGVEVPRNITNSAEASEDDADWSPDSQKIVFTSHPVTDNPVHSIHAEIYVMNADGTGRVQLTNNLEEERAPAWSPDGTRILFMCRIGPPPPQPAPQIPTFEICVMYADGTGRVRLTNNGVGDLTPTWSPDGQKITFHKLSPVAGEGTQLFVMNADGTGETQLTHPPGLNAFARWGEVLIPGSTLKVENGTGDGSYAPGTIVTVTADPAPAGQHFVGWTGDIVILSNPNLETTTAIIPSMDVAIVAKYRMNSETSLPIEGN
jgi:Tol biopolymer transport system component